MNTYLGLLYRTGRQRTSPKTTMGTPESAVLIEGYVWDLPEGPDLTAKAIDIARRNGTAVALSLSDSFCVERTSRR